MQATRILKYDADSTTFHIIPVETRQPAAIDKRVNEELSEKAEHDNHIEESTKTSVSDPIRMFGILVPQSLRSAQSESIKLAEEILPKIVALSNKMQRVEIEIRRKKKHRAKMATLPTTSTAVQRKMPQDAA